MALPPSSGGVKPPPRVRGTYRKLAWWRRPIADTCIANAILHGNSPSPKVLFRCLELTKFEDIRAVIVGDPPLPDPRLADGLTFSQYPHAAVSPTTNAIFDEYQADLKLRRPTTGDLTPWAMNGILLLPRALSVNPSNRPEHDLPEFGWQSFVFELLRTISTRHKRVAFMMCGHYASRYAPCVDTDKHLLLVTEHPLFERMPFTARHRDPLPPFRGTRPFTTISNYIDIPSEKLWRLP